MDGWIIIILSWRVSLLGRDVGTPLETRPLSSLSWRVGWLVGACTRTAPLLINVVLAARLLRVGRGGVWRSLIGSCRWWDYAEFGGTRRGYYKILMGRLKFGRVKRLAGFLLCFERCCNWRKNLQKESMVFSEALNGGSDCREICYGLIQDQERKVRFELSRNCRWFLEIGFNKVGLIQDRGVRWFRGTRFGWKLMIFRRPDSLEVNFKSTIDSRSWLIWRK